MPPLPNVPNCIEYTLRFSDGGNTNLLNKFHQTYTNPPGQSDALALAQTVTAQWGTHMASQVGTWINLLQTEVNDLASVFGAQAVDITGSVGTGAQGTHLASGTAMVISSKTAHKYRGGHGRVYVPGLGTAALQTPNTWTTLVQSSVASAWAAFVGGIISHAPTAMGAMQNVVVHRYGRCPSPPCTPPPNEDAPSVPLLSPYTDTITSWSVNPKVGSQRRRNLQTT